jgi:hypothetical protein
MIFKYIPNSNCHDKIPNSIFKDVIKDELELTENTIYGTELEPTNSITSYNSDKPINREL